VKVCLLRTASSQSLTFCEVTTHAFDAASEKDIIAICDQALKEEGRLDVFFANAGIASRDTLANTTAETFMESMRVNSLS
jgi:NAD(P)-dependent dehydrogenase (short-subunit alcohol dehydrogenase family)